MILCFILEFEECRKSLDISQKGKYYCVYYDENRYWGRLLQVIQSIDKFPYSNLIFRLYAICNCYSLIEQQKNKVNGNQNYGRF